MKYFQNKRLKLLSQKLILTVLVSILITGCVPGLGSGAAKPKPEGEFKAGAIVAGFPTLPSYPKAKVIESYGASNSFGASLVSDDPITKVFDYYNGAFATLGWSANAHKKNDTNIVYDIKNDRYAGQVILNTASDGKMTAITIAVSTR